MNMQRQFRSGQPVRRESGLSLVELMVAMTISLLLLAGLVTLVVNANGNQANLTQIGARDENGRYALKQIASDVHLAGFYGYLYDVAAPTAPLTDPCSVAQADLYTGLRLPVQGYSPQGTAPNPLTCVPGWASGTEILVVRHAATAVASTQGSATTGLTVGQWYLQSNSTQYLFELGENEAQFLLGNLNNGLPPPIRLYEEHIYFISPCLVLVNGACPANGIPTLKRVDLGVVNGAPAMLAPVPVATGVDAMHIDYGVDTNGDGTPDTYKSNIGTQLLTTADWGNVVTLRVSLLAQSEKPLAGWNPSSQAYNYILSATNPPVSKPYQDAYTRHVFTQLIRLTNVDQRRVN